ncbi:WcaF family extracellular polysaccharide biosynthesis acetyltransferase [Flavihumibacter fluvii]|uniref:WcaF family extracellular polysaccharide biosynthesis acetyltransferase n=1 Tax=Flavihumibacter fluvii TaxID=2838157 RepID=UPI001BDE8575|nr:WcaF family extracellular polysaccharide biosynthesis acetyltransferase [Flavihumibacter fluvii]ULQ52405.1 WcaF family extracellular polysaccharide biosynthesis acetyltransferase [Flavihumibacter fluvii]
MATNLSDYNNSWYKDQIGAGRLKQFIWYYTNLLIFNNGLFPVSSIKVVLLRWFGATIGKSVLIKPSVNIKYPWKLVIGDHTWIGENVWIDNLADVSIGSHVCLSQGAFLLTGNHDFKSKTFDLMVKPIKLEDGVWIGAQAIVCPGVNCHHSSVLSVSSVATKDLEAYTIYQGNPAIPVKTRIISD